MKWLPPNSNTDFKLYLPTLQHQEWVQFHDIHFNNDLICNKVSKSFCDVWENGPSDPDSLENITACLITLFQAFSPLIKQAQGNVSVQHKERLTDLVTEVDTGIEMLYRMWINRFFPSHRIIGEEGFKSSFNEQDIVWYIDPIDGTNNFIKGRQEVTLHLSCLQDGVPLISFVGCPLSGNCYFSYDSSEAVYKLESNVTSIVQTPALPEQVIIGTEFLESSDKERSVFQSTLDNNAFSSLRIKSMGMNLISLLEGKSTAFYKAGVKLWDIMAPLGLLYHLDTFDITIGIPTDDHSLPKPIQWVSPFSASSSFIDYLNKKHQSNCRIGLVIVTPKSRPDLKSIIANSHQIAI